MSQARHVFIHGIVMASDWEDDENPTRLVIENQAEEDEILVANEGLGEDLFDYLREEVEIRGILRTTGSGRPEIVVQSYRVFNAEDEEYV